jgi:hypothetical protein
MDSHDDDIPRGLVHSPISSAIAGHPIYSLRAWQQPSALGRHPGRQKNQESVDSTRVRDTVTPGAHSKRFQVIAPPASAARPIPLYSVTVAALRHG